MVHRVGLPVVLLCWVCAAAFSFSNDKTENKNVQIIEVQGQNATRLFAKLEDCTEATITVTATLNNTACSVPVPFTVDSEGRQHFQLVAFTADDPHIAWHYSFHFDYKPGGQLKKKLKSYVYSLPYRGGEDRGCQAPHWKFNSLPYWGH